MRVLQGPDGKYFVRGHGFIGNHIEASQLELDEAEALKAAHPLSRLVIPNSTPNGKDCLRGALGVAVVVNRETGEMRPQVLRYDEDQHELETTLEDNEVLFVCDIESAISNEPEGVETMISDD